MSLILKKETRMSLSLCFSSLSLGCLTLARVRKPSSKCPGIAGWQAWLGSGVARVLSDSVHHQQLRTPAAAHVITAQTNGLL